MDGMGPDSDARTDASSASYIAEKSYAIVLMKSDSSRCRRWIFISVKVFFLSKAPIHLSNYA